MNYSILIPTRKRPQLLTGLIQSIYDTVEDKSNTEIHIAYDLDDNKTIKIIDSLKEIYKAIKIDFHGRERSHHLNDDYHNWMATNFVEGKYIMAINDDTKFINHGWDNMAIKKIDDYLKDKPDGIFYGITEDKEFESRRNESNYFSCFPLISKAGINALGYLFDPRCRRHGADWDIVILYRGINRILDLRKEIIIEHISVRSGRRHEDELDHDTIGLCPLPNETYINRTNFLNDYIRNYGTDKYRGTNMLSIQRMVQRQVSKIYTDILKREPGPIELEHYVNDISLGKMTKENLLEILKTSEGYIGTDDVRNFVIQGYRNILKKEPDPRELIHCANYIYSGGITKDRFLEILKNYEEYISPVKIIEKTGTIDIPKVTNTDLGEDIRNFVTQGYRDILKREPDSSGFEHYTNEISSGKITKDRFLEILKTSDEYRYSEMIIKGLSTIDIPKVTNTDLGEDIRNFVIQGYRDILRREPDPGGLEHYTNKIYLGEITKDRFLEILKTSDEYRNKFG